jgi:hypothetical protein
MLNIFQFGLAVAVIFTSAEKTESIYQSTRTEYVYYNAKGEPLYTKVRIEPGFGDRKKDFHLEHTDADGKIHKYPEYYDLEYEGLEIVLYRLPELLESLKNHQTVFLVEGEKDTGSLIQNGLSATTSPSALIWYTRFTEILKEADVVILFDYDQTGFERRDMLCCALDGKVGRLRLVDLPGLIYQETHGSDITDWLQQGHTTHELLQLVEQTPDYRCTDPHAKAPRP